MTFTCTRQERKKGCRFPRCHKRTEEAVEQTCQPPPLKWRKTLLTIAKPKYTHWSFWSGRRILERLTPVNSKVWDISQPRAAPLAENQGKKLGHCPPHLTVTQPKCHCTALTATNSAPQVALIAVSPTQQHLAQGLALAQCWVWGALMGTEARGPFNHTRRHLAATPIAGSDPCWEGRSNHIFRFYPIPLLAPSALNSTLSTLVTLMAHFSISKGIGLTKCLRKHNLFHFETP